MASLSLKTEVIDRVTLYYNKYEYRVTLNSPHMFYSWNCKNIADYRARIIEICEEYDRHEDKSKWFFSRRPRPQVEEWEYKLIENIFNLQQRYNKQDFTVRRENITCCFYTSNVKLVKEILKFAPEATVTQVSLMPGGVMTFSREPPAKFRAYMSNKKMPIGFKEDLLEYLSRTSDINPSDAFYKYLHRSLKYSREAYLWDKYFLDYNDEKNLMMMSLMFPGMIGKKFKLEKKA